MDWTLPHIPLKAPAPEPSTGVGNLCLDCMGCTAGKPVGFYPCHGEGGAQQWQLVPFPWVRCLHCGCSTMMAEEGAFPMFHSRSTIWIPS
jgi:hypothetical protein